MTIVYITYSILITGGIERILTDKMNWLAENTNHSIHLITWEQHGNPFCFELSAKVKHHDLGLNSFTVYHHNIFIQPFFKWRMNKKLQKALQDKVAILHPDILIANTNYHPEVICALKTNAIRIIESHSYKYSIGASELFKSSLIKAHVRKCIINQHFKQVEKKADYIITLTNNDASFWNKNGGGAEVNVIPNMIARHNYQVVDYAVHRIIAVGRLVHQKGFDILIKIWEKVSHKYPDWVLDIYGDGQGKDYLQSLIEERNLQNSLALRGETKNIYNELVKSSIFVLTSRTEGFALCLAEAMSCGLPAVAFNCPFGPSDIIQNNEDGFLIEPNDIEDFTQKLETLIEHEEIRKRMGEKAKQNTERFFADNIMPQWISLFEQATKKRDAVR